MPVCLCLHDCFLCKGDVFVGSLCVCGLFVCLWALCVYVGLFVCICVIVCLDPVKTILEDDRLI